MNERFTQQQIDAHNLRVMKTAAAHNFDAGVGEHTFEPVATDFLVGTSTDVAKLNKTERAYFNFLKSLHLPYLGVQNITIKLADDCRFTPDFNYIDPNGKMTFVDVKGFQREDALIKIRVAARTYRWATFIIVKKNKTVWETETVKP